MRGIINELGGENIDIVEQSDDPAKFITNAFKPAEISEIHLNEKRKRARVYVQKEFLPQAIGKGGRNVRLASLLTGWDISVMEAPVLGEVKKNEKDSKEGS
jgi:N utilization substance protein A